MATRDEIRNRIRNLLGASSIFSGGGVVTYQYFDGTTKTMSENATIKINSSEDFDVYQYKVTTSNDSSDDFDDSDVSGLFSIKDTTSDADYLRITGIPYNGSGNAQLTFSSNGNYTDFTATVNDINTSVRIVAYSSSYSLNRVQPLYTVETQVISTANAANLRTLNGTYTVDATTLSGALSGALSGNFNIDAVGYSSNGKITVTGDLANVGKFSANLNPSGKVVVATAEKKGYNLMDTLMSSLDHCYQHNDAILTAQSDLGNNYTITSNSTSSVRVTYF
jgi:hypothetical protein